MGLFTGSCSCEHCCSFTFSVVVRLMCILSIFVYLSLTLWVYQPGECAMIHTFVRRYVHSFGWFRFDSTQFDFKARQFSITTCKARSTSKLQCIYLSVWLVYVHVYPTLIFHSFLLEGKMHRDGVEGESMVRGEMKMFETFQVSSHQFMSYCSHWMLIANERLVQLFYFVGVGDNRRLKPTASKGVSYSIGKKMFVWVLASMSAYICIYFSTVDMHFPFPNNFERFNVIERAERELNLAILKAFWSISVFVCIVGLFCFSCSWE